MNNLAEAHRVWDRLIREPIRLGEWQYRLPKGVEIHLVKSGRDRFSAYRRAKLSFRSKGRTGAGVRYHLEQIYRASGRTILVDVTPKRRRR